ncbi:hypothetical protein FJZ33_12265, partial [Candidatus Poribacteria bacterium]|nr:hypothetical protein [Candidatus Poribacteria bacterium]
MLTGLLIVFSIITATEGLGNSITSFPRIANCYGVGLTPENRVKDIDEISRTDLLIGGLWCNWNNPEHMKKLHERIAEVRKKNPNIIILDFSVSAPYAEPDDKAFPE